jgi:hypothetical protein
MFLIPFILVFALLIGFFLYKHYKVEIDRALILRKRKNELPLFKKEVSELSHLFNQLNPSQLQQLFHTSLIFLYEKKWSSNLSFKEKCQESLKACLPLYRKKSNFYPKIKKIEKKRELKQWLDLHEPQFAVEMGKDQLLKFKGEFSKYAEIFLREEGNRIKNEEKEKELFQLLERYFAP